MLVVLKSIKIFKLDIALREPFRISFQTFTHLNNVLITLTSTDNISSCGEAAPFKPITGDSREEAIRFLQLAAGRLIGRDIRDLHELHMILNELEHDSGLISQTAKTALDTAFLCLIGKIENKPVFKLLGASKPNIVKNTLTIGIKSIQDTVRTVKEYMGEFSEFGLSRIKLKLAGDSEKDINRVIKVAEVFDGELTLDANQGYVDPEIAARTFNRMYEEIGERIILIEEPCPKGDIDKLKYVKEHSEIPIFADESAATFEDAKKVIEHEAADGINIKLQKAGGIYWGKKIAELANDYNIKLMTGCMLETGISIAAGVNFASAMKGMINTDLDSDLTLPINIVEKPLPFQNGARIPIDKPGLGISLRKEIRDIINGTLSLIPVF